MWLLLRYLPGSDLCDLFGCFIRDPFRGENVTFIWVIKLGHDWKKLVCEIYVSKVLTTSPTKNVRSPMLSDFEGKKHVSGNTMVTVFQVKDTLPETQWLVGR